MHTTSYKKVWRENREFNEMKSVTCWVRQELLRRKQKPCNGHLLVASDENESSDYVDVSGI